MVQMGIMYQHSLQKQLVTVTVRKRHQEMLKLAGMPGWQARGPRCQRIRTVPWNLQFGAKNCSQIDGGRRPPFSTSWAWRCERCMVHLAHGGNHSCRIGEDMQLMK